MDSMKSQTTITASKTFTKHTMFLNDKEESVAESARLTAIIDALLPLAEDYVKDGKVVIAKADWPKYHLQIVSHNNFPTAAGLASSASGYACFARCLATLFGVVEKTEGFLSTIARQGSGSACRSLYGGFAAWEMGKAADGHDSIAVPIVDESYWPEMRVLICVANNASKETPSTAGMQMSVKTSDLLQARIPLVEKLMKEMEKHIRARDFESFGKATMRDSNQFHAVCCDTYPPIFYMNETSQRIIHVVHAINKHFNKIIAAYTFDAGPNAVIYLLEKDMKCVLDVLLHYFQDTSQPLSSFINDKMKLGECAFIDRFLSLLAFLFFISFVHSRLFRCYPSLFCSFLFVCVLYLNF